MNQYYEIEDLILEGSRAIRKKTRDVWATVVKKHDWSSTTSQRRIGS